MSEILELLVSPEHPKQRTAFDAMVPYMEAAVNFAEAGEWANEVKSLESAHSKALAIGGFKGNSIYKAAEDTLLNAGLIFRGAERVGRLVETHARDNSNAIQFLRTGTLPDVRIISVWTDRVICDEKVVPIDEFTSASVFVDGVDQITQRPTLTRMALLAPLPGSALLAGFALQKKTRNDLREVTFSLASADWQFSIRISTSSIQEAKSMAERVNAIAAKLEKDASNSQGSQFKPSHADQISSLASLLASGTLTQEEFQILKSKIINN